MGRGFLKPIAANGPQAARMLESDFARAVDGCASRAAGGFFRLLLFRASLLDHSDGGAQHRAR